MVPFQFEGCNNSTGSILGTERLACCLYSKYNYVPVCIDILDTSSTGSILEEQLTCCLNSKYSVSTNFHLELIELSAREVEGQQLFFSSGAVMSLSRFDPWSSPLLTRPPLALSTRVQEISTSLADDSISSRRKLVDTL